MSVPMDLANCWIDMVPIYNGVSFRSRKCFELFWGECTNSNLPREIIRSLKKCNPPPCVFLGMGGNCLTTHSKKIRGKNKDICKLNLYNRFKKCLISLATTSPLPWLKVTLGKLFYFTVINYRNNFFFFLQRN